MNPNDNAPTKLYLLARQLQHDLKFTYAESLVGERTDIILKAWAEFLKWRTGEIEILSTAQSPITWESSSGATWYSVDRDNRRLYKCKSCKEIVWSIITRFVGDLMCPSCRVYGEMNVVWTTNPQPTPEECQELERKAEDWQGSCGQYVQIKQTE